MRKALRKALDRIDQGAKRREKIRVQGNKRKHLRQQNTRGSLSG